MTSPPIRPNIVRELVELFADETLSEDAVVGLVQNSDATIAEKEAAKLAFGRLIIKELVLAGVAEDATPSVFDLSMREIRGFAGVWNVLRRWDISLRDDYRLE